MSDFTIVTVLHDSAPQLVRLLDSLDRHLPDQAQVVAVDTGSRDDGAAQARARGVTVVELPDNPGFGAANNAGIEHAEHDVTVLLNPDIELVDDSLRNLVEDARACDALLVPRLLNRDGTIQDSAHPEPGTRREIVRAFFPRTGEPWRADEPRQVGWAIAAALAAKTTILKRLGPFDPDGFLFYEDMELCLRADVPTCLVPDVQLIHDGGHSTGATNRLEQEAQRRRDVVADTRGATAQRRDDLAQLLTFARAAAFKRRARDQLRALRVARRA
jgi:N-acetylglucosaminyl-diphospho-decaprenol L-rhamnosyltransferase